MPKTINFVLIMPDQQRQDSLGCYGNTFVKTPNIDRLAKESVTFDSCLTPFPLCTPARATMWTGLYPHAHGMIFNRYDIDDVFTYEGRVTGSIFESFKSNGFTTAYFGKWHLGLKDPDRFDIWEGFNSEGGHWVDGFNAFQEGKYKPEAQTDSCIKFLKSDLAKEKPFIMVQGYYPPHNPYTAPKHFYKLYRGKGFLFPGYYAAVSALDHYTGQILKTLDEEGLRENTVVIYFSDHGESFRYREFTTNKWLCYEESIKIPMIVSQPGSLPSGKRVSQFVGLQDLAPTLLDIAGIKAPYPMHGKSMVGLMNDREENWRESFYIQSEVRTVRTPQRCVRTSEWKLILRGDEQHHLYNLIWDPEEEYNVFDAPYKEKHRQFENFPDYTEIICELSKEMVEHAKNINDPTGVELAERVLRQRKHGAKKNVDN